KCRIGSKWSGEWVMDFDARGAKVRNIPSCNGQDMDQCSSCDEAILDGHRRAGCAQIGKQSRPAQPRFGSPREALEPADAFFEPGYQSTPSFSWGKQQYAEANFAEDDRIDGELSLMFAQPIHDLDFRCRLGWLGKHIGIDEVDHNVSVDSDSM